MSWRVNLPQLAVSCSCRQQIPIIRKTQPLRKSWRPSSQRGIRNGSFPRPAESSMHYSAEKTPASSVDDDGRPWWRLLTRYHWLVLTVAVLGWLFDTMDQQLFVLNRARAMQDLVSPGQMSELGAYATSIFMLGWATGGLLFGVVGDRVGRAKTMMLTILIYSVFTGL